MPKIRPYQQQLVPEGAIRSQAQGSDFGGPGLEHVGAAVTGAGFAFTRADAVMQQAQARQETTNADLAVTQLHTDLVQEINRRRAAHQPGDPPLASDFTTYIKTKLDEVAGGSEYERYQTAAGQQTFRARAAHMTASIMEGLIPIDAQLAGKHAATEFARVTDASANLLINSPTMFAMKKAELDATINNRDGLFASLTTAERGALLQSGHEKLATNAAQGFIRLRPNLALEVLTDPELAKNPQYGWIAEHIPQEKMGPLIEHARVAVHVQESANKAALTAQEHMLDQGAEAEQGQLVSQYFAWKADPAKNPPVTPIDFLNKTLLLSRKPAAALAFQGVIEQDTREEAARQTAQQELASLSQYSQLINRHLANLENPKKNPPLSTAEIRRMDELMSRHPEKGLALQERLEALQRQQGEMINKGDPETYRALYDQLAAGKISDITPINRARSAGRISAEQHKELIGEFNDSRGPDGMTLVQKKNEFFAAVKPFIAPTDANGLMVDPSMGLRFYQFQHDTILAVARAKQEGTAAAHALLDPASPSYLGTPERIRPYTKTYMERIESAIEQRGLSSGTPKRKPLDEIFGAPKHGQ